MFSKTPLTIHICETPYRVAVRLAGLRHTYLEGHVSYNLRHLRVAHSETNTAPSPAEFHPFLRIPCPLLLAQLANVCLHTTPSPLQFFFSILLLANFSCHLLTFGGALASPSCNINSIVSSIFAIVVIDGKGMNVKASSACVGPVDEGLRIKIGFEVFFCRIWYFLSP
jgi:hypothetical protein